jgi:hypothetical protein
VIDKESQYDCVTDALDEGLYNITEHALVRDVGIHMLIVECRLWHKGRSLNVEQRRRRGIINSRVT